MHGSLTEPTFSQRDVPLQSRDRGDSQPEECPLQIQKMRQPGVPVAICFMLGIAADRLLDLPWMIAGAGTAACWIVFHLKKTMLSPWLLFLDVACC